VPVTSSPRRRRSRQCTHPSTHPTARRRRCRTCPRDTSASHRRRSSDPRDTPPATTDAHRRGLQRRWDRSSCRRPLESATASSAVSETHTHTPPPITFSRTAGTHRVGSHHSPQDRVSTVHHTPTRSALATRGHSRIQHSSLQSTATTPRQGCLRSDQLQTHSHSQPRSQLSTTTNATPLDVTHLNMTVAHPPRSTCPVGTRARCRTQADCCPRLQRRSAQTASTADPATPTDSASWR
jgi:hypothetical protein